MFDPGRVEPQDTPDREFIPDAPVLRHRYCALIAEAESEDRGKQ
jgi:hypothetical protein